MAIRTHVTCLKGEEQQSTGTGVALGWETRRQEQLPSPAAESGCTRLPESSSVPFVLGDRSGSLQEQTCHSFPPLLSGEREHSTEKRCIMQIPQSFPTQERLKVQLTVLAWWEASTA